MLALGFLMALAALGLGILVLVTWTGIWRILGMLAPLSVIGTWLKIKIGIALDPSSNNLWPFDVLIVSALALAYLGIVWLFKSLLTFGSNRRAEIKKYRDEELPFAKIMHRARRSRRRKD